ncbi:MAG: LamG domain-containing protein [Acidobacteria bacterium]|nr:LamG domain-containing protein [Acidobacteriota bacterium]
MSRFAPCLALGIALGCAPLPRADVPGVVMPGLESNLISFYDFEHPVAGDASREADLGSSGTAISLVHGGAAMRVNDGAHSASTFSLQTRQNTPNAPGNDDWKAGIYDARGVSSMTAFASVAGITVMGWVKPTGTNPSPNSNTADPNDLFGAVGLFGILAGDSEGHGVRALLEVIDVAGTQRLVALGRRVDGGSSLVLAATDDWRTLLPNDTWTHLTATFDFDDGTMALYRNGLSLAAEYTSAADPWSVTGPPEPDLTSASSPAGIKIGGSFPQGTAERNPFNGRLDDLMFFNRTLSADEVKRQYTRVSPQG